MDQTSPAATIDACVLYRKVVRDLLIHISKAGLFRARWSHEIHNEWINAVIRKRPDISQEFLRETSRRMDEVILDSSVIGHMDLVNGLSLPSAKDRHVLAAAIHSQSEYIVTLNLDDFGKSHLEPFGIQALSPDDFVEVMGRVDRFKLTSAAQNHRFRLQAKNPTSPDEYLQMLRNNGLVKSADLLGWLGGRFL